MLLKVGTSVPDYQIAPGSVWTLTVTNPMVADWRIYKFRCDVKHKETGNLAFTVSSEDEEFAVDGTNHKKVTMTFPGNKTTLLTPGEVYEYDIYAFLTADLDVEIPFILASNLHCVTRITSETYDA